MRSEKQIAASRANGALSRGPKTPEGKARSSRNAMRHGLLSSIIVLEEEPGDGFRQLFDAYTDRFGPLDDVEIGMVEEMCATWWRMRRVWAIENRYLDTSVAKQTSASPADRLMDAFTELTASKSLTLLHRYETRLHMMYQRAFRNFTALRKLPQAAPPPPTPAIPNEPNNPPVINQTPTHEPKPEPTEPNQPKVGQAVSPANPTLSPANPSPRLRVSAFRTNPHTSPKFQT